MSVSLSNWAAAECGLDAGNGATYTCGAVGGHERAAQNKGRTVLTAALYIMTAKKAGR